jgi:putative spermidine/putrescine transport system substrate-binding protein
MMVPAYTYALVSAFRYDAVLRIGEPQSWQEWWDTGRYSGARALSRSAFGNFEFALLASGVTPDKLYPLDSAAAVESLKKISGKIVDRWWDSAEQPVAWLTSKFTDFTPAWHFRVQTAQDGPRQFDLTWNQGLLLYDCWTIAKGAAQMDIAADFIRYATSAEAQAALASSIRLGPVTPDAFSQVAPDVINLLPTTSDNLGKLIILDVNWWATNNVEANERFNSWLLGVPFHG